MVLQFKNAWICQATENAVQPVFGDLTVSDGRIADITVNPKGAPDTKIAEGWDVIDLKGRMVTIPNVNFHEHIYSRLAKGLPISGPMGNFVQILENLWWKLDRYLDEEMIAASARMAIRESLRNGVTYLFDHHASPGAVTGSLKIIADEMKKAGLRAALCFEVSDRNGDDIARASVRENIQFISEQTDQDIKGMMGLHALFTLSDETLQAIGESLPDLNTGIHVHVAEDKADVDVNREKYGLAIAERLQKFGLLNERSILVHGVHLGERDYRVITEAGAALAYNPDSNLNNAVGLPDYKSVPRAIPVLAGTDGMHANVARSLKQLFLLRRHQQNSFDDAFGWIIKIYFDQIRFVRRYFPDYPLLQKGERADFVVWDYQPPTPLNADNFWGHYIYGTLEAPVFSLVQNGHLLLHRGQITAPGWAADEGEIRRQGERLFRKFQQR